MSTFCWQAVSGIIEKEAQDQSSEAESQNANSGAEDGNETSSVKMVANCFILTLDNAMSADEGTTAKLSKLSNGRSKKSSKRAK